MSALQKAATQALEALEWADNAMYEGTPIQVNTQKAITALRTALTEQLEQDRHQTFIDTLPDHLDDKMFEQIDLWARQTYKRHQSQVRGQMFDSRDSHQTHLIYAAFRWAKEHGNPLGDATDAPQPAKPAEQEPVAWCDVAGFESYEVSSNGDLRNKKTGRIMAKNLAGAGYVKADLWANGQRKQTTVHRLVAEAFLGPAEGREVNHKNGNKQDNRVSNLEWCSRSDNVNHGYYKLGIRVKPIRVTNIATGEVRCYPSANEAVRDGFHSARIHECLSGKRTSHGGFSFEYDTAPQPKREPLTDEDIDQVTDTQWASNNHRPIYAAHRAYARAIERAHGIGGQP